MKTTTVSILLLTSSSALLVQSAPLGLLRINDNDNNNESINTPANDEMESVVNDFRTLFEEDLNFNIRGLVGDNLSLSMSLSFPLPYFTPSPTTAPSASPLASDVPSNVPSSSTVPFTTPSILPTSVDEIAVPTTISSPSSPSTPTTTTTTSTDEDSVSEKISTKTGSNESEEQSTRNIAMIVVGSCAFIAIAAIAARKLISPSKTPVGSSSKELAGGAAIATGAAASDGSTSGGGNDVSSIGTSSDFDGGSIEQHPSPEDGVPPVEDIQL